MGVRVWGREILRVDFEGFEVGNPPVERGKSRAQMHFSIQLKQCLPSFLRRWSAQICVSKDAEIGNRPCAQESKLCQVGKMLKWPV